MRVYREKNASLWNLTCFDEPGAACFPLYKAMKRLLHIHI